MHREEILENLSDTDLDFAMTEIYQINLGEKNIKLIDTIMLYEIYNNLEDIKAFNTEDSYSQLCLWCSLEFSYRKLGLK